MTDTSAKALKYSNKQWIEIDDIVCNACEIGEFMDDKLYELLGYDGKDCIFEYTPNGIPDTLVELYYHRGIKSYSPIPIYPYLIDITLYGNTSHSIYCDTFQDMLELLNILAPIYNTKILSTLLNRYNDILEILMKKT